MSLFFPAAAPATPARIAEALGSPDADDDLYRRAGGAQRDLLGTTLWRAQELCVHLYRSNPLANRIIKIYTTFMAGSGFSAEAHNTEVQAILDEFWGSPRNRLDLNHRGYARDYLLFGESIHPVAADEMGSTTLGFIDPTRIDHIERDERNNMILDRLHLQRSWSRDERPLQIVRTTEDPFDVAAGLLVGDVLVWLHDRIGAATRGTPFLLPAVDWLDAYDQTLWELLERVKATRAFFWDVAVEGGADEVEEAKRIWGTTPPRSGSIRFRTNAMEVSATQPSIAAYEDVAASRLILRHIAAAAGVAPHWLGDPEDANRSTAESMDAPVLRALEDAQADWRLRMTEAAQFAVDRKVAAGLLPRIVAKEDEFGRTTDRLPARDTVEIVTPSLSDDDITAAAAALAQVAQAFIQLDMVDAVDANVARRIVRQLLPALGIPAEELPDPTEDEGEDGPATRAEIEALESLYRQGRRGKLDQLLQEMSKVD